MSLLNLHEEQRSQPAAWVPVGFIPNYDPTVAEDRKGRGLDSDPPMRPSVRRSAAARRGLFSPTPIVIASRKRPTSMYMQLDLGLCHGILHFGWYRVILWKQGCSMNARAEAKALARAVRRAAKQSAANAVPGSATAP